MAKTIHKFPLEVTQRQGIYLPQWAEPLTVKIQLGAPQLWVLLDPDKPHDHRWEFWTFGTGKPIPDKFELGYYLATYQLREGTFIGHVFVVERGRIKTRPVKTVPVDERIL